MNETDAISRQMAIDTIMGQPPEPHYPSWYAAQIEELPAVQPDHTADTSKKVEGDCISRQAAIDAMKDMYRAAEKWLRDATDDVTKARAESCMASLVEIKLRTEKLPAVQPDHNTDVSKKVDMMHEYIYKIVKDCDGVNCYIKQGKIIRCKDCKHKHVENMIWTCPFGLPGGENFFCGYGTEPYKGE